MTEFYCYKFTGLQDRTSWPKSPFDVDPWAHEQADKIIWYHTTHKLHCMIIRSSLGVWCGYVAVLEKHPLYGLDYYECLNYVKDNNIDVHGGLTASGEMITEPSQPVNAWWFGFDCAHWGDFIPGLGWTAPVPECPVYRNSIFVIKETENLALQLANVKQETVFNIKDWL
jgi:hypothetical protein